MRGSRAEAEEILAHARERIESAIVNLASNEVTNDAGAVATRVISEEVQSLGEIVEHLNRLLE